MPTYRNVLRNWLEKLSSKITANYHNPPTINALHKQHTVKLLKNKLNLHSVNLCTYWLYLYSQRSSSAQPSATLSNSFLYSAHLTHLAKEQPSEMYPNTQQPPGTSWQLGDSSCDLTGTWWSLKYGKAGHTQRRSHLLTRVQEKQKYSTNYGLLFICLTVSDNPSQTSYNPTIPETKIGGKKTKQGLFLLHLQRKKMHFAQKTFP